METDEDLVLTEVVDGIAVVRMNRVSALNALNPELFLELLFRLKVCDKDPSIHCVLLASESKAFCVGADVKHMAATAAQPAAVVEYLKMFDVVAETSKPLIALVNGAAFGGGFELALACDLILASSKAIFAFPEIDLGLLPGGGGTQRITRLIGKQRAMELILTGGRLSAKDGEELGFVNKVCEPDQLVEEGFKLARQIAVKRQAALLAAKQAINAALEGDINDGLRFEKELFANLISTENGKEGINAFLEKRAPIWSND